MSVRCSAGQTGTCQATSHPHAQDTATATGGSGSPSLAAGDFAALSPSRVFPTRSSVLLHGDRHRLFPFTPQQPRAAPGPVLLIQPMMVFPRLRPTAPGCPAAFQADLAAPHPSCRVFIWPTRTLLLLRSLCALRALTCCLQQHRAPATSEALAVHKI